MKILVCSGMQKKMIGCLRQLTLNALILSVLAFAWIVPETASAQVHTFTKEQMEIFTASNPYGRFPDGRPMIPDAVIDSVRNLQIQTIEALEALAMHKYNNSQFEGGWKTLIPGEKIVGRAFTVQFMPPRPDLQEGIQSMAKKNNTTAVSKSASIDMLQENDLAVIDLYGKVEGGLPYVGDKLAYYIWKTTGTGFIVDGGIYFLETMQQDGVQAFYRGGSPLTNTGFAIVTGVNIPVRLGDAVILPGDLVIGDEDGIVAVPPHLVSSVIKTTIMNRRRDVWIKKAFDLGRYKSSEIYGRMQEPLRTQFSNYRETGDPKYLPK
jgi:regulator of RNase E activity RraA